MKYGIRLFLLFVICWMSSLIAQDNKENWVSILSTTPNEVYVNTQGLDVFQGDDIYAWVRTVYYPPMEVETIDKDVYTSKEYWLINKKLRRYSILQVIYYDKNGNVLKSFSYNHDSDVMVYKYNYPIIPDSDEDKILNECLRAVGTTTNTDSSGVKN